VEPPGGVAARNRPPFYQDQPGAATSLTFWFFNTSKRSITCDLNSADGRALFAKLVGTAQIVLEGDPPGGLDALGVVGDAGTGVTSNGIVALHAVVPEAVPDVPVLVDHVTLATPDGSEAVPRKVSDVWVVASDVVAG